jgi:hypothetical protein
VYQISLIEGATQKPVIAVIVPMTDKHLDDVETFWRPRLRTTGALDASWNWKYKKRVYEIRSKTVENWAIEFENITQGLIMLDITGRRSLINGENTILYVNCIATAPWNRVEIENPPILKTVGRSLLKFAQAKSKYLGFSGRIGLHALPQAEAFYRKLNMMEILGDSDEFDAEESLTYFEWASS